MTAPAPPAIDGDPAAIRHAAARMRHVAVRVDGAAGVVERGASSARNGWSGAAQAAFVSATTETGVRVRAMRQYVMAADVLDTYADTLEELQRRHAEAQAQLSAASRSTGGAPGRDGFTGFLGGPTPAEAVALAARQAAARDAATLEMARLVNDALAANEQAARAVELLAGPARDPVRGVQGANTVASTVTGATTTTVQGADNLLTGAAGAVAAHPALGEAGQVAKNAGYVGSVGFNAFGQVSKDADNPYYSNAERAGRATAQVVSVGGTALSAGAVGAAAGSLILPGVGTVVGGVIGAVGGYYLADYVDSGNDEFVDGMGEHVDSLGETAKDIAPW